MSCHLAEVAVAADHVNKQAHTVRAQVFQARRDGESSLMTTGNFGYAANETKKKAE